MGVATNNWPFLRWRGYLSFYLVLLTNVFISLNATQDLTESCSVVQLDKVIHQDTYTTGSSANCVLFRFEREPVDADPSDGAGKFVFVTIYNVSISPMFGMSDMSIDDQLDNSSKKLSRYCELLEDQSIKVSKLCSLCAAPLDGETTTSNNNSSVEARISQSISCLSTTSAQGRHFRIPVGGRLLIIAKKQPSYYAYRFSYKYVYETVCPSLTYNNNKNDVDDLFVKPAQWCLGSVRLNDGTLDESNHICIASKWLCDGFFDCLDGSDESCCPPKYTRCAPWEGLAGKCVPRCNGRSECQTGANELDCRLLDCQEPNLSCRVPSDDSYSDQPIGGFQCLPANRRCNGLAECAEALDELGCDASNCGPENGTYLCESDISGRCIRQDFVCDGQPHCPNGDDEAFCPILSRRLNIVLCMSGLFSCASVLFVIAYFHRRYCMAYRRSRGRHRRRRFDLMSPVEQAARYFMQMCGAPPSYTQVMQMGDGDSVAPIVAPMEEPSHPLAATLATVDVMVPPPPPPLQQLQAAPQDRDVSISCDDESSEAEYLSTLTFPHNNNNSNDTTRPNNINNSVQIHAPANFLLQRHGNHQDDQAEYAECADDPCPPPAFAPASSDADVSLCSSHIEMTTTCSSTIASEADYASNNNNNNDESQVITHLHRRPSSEDH